MFQFTHPRGVRQVRGELDRLSAEFQFTHPRGVRRSQLTPSIVVSVFQFTHPRGVRLVVLSCAFIHKISFNSRTREGCDILTLSPQPLTICFNSRTREGCDRALGETELFEEEFQFTHPRGVRHRGEVLRVIPHDVSIHAPARGATAPCLWRC